MSELQLSREQLERRPVRPIQSTFFNSILVNLEYREAEVPGSGITGLPWAVMEATGAQSAGLSLLSGDEAVCWAVVSGRWAAHARQCFRLTDLPCALALQAGQLLVLTGPARAFPALHAFHPGVSEGMYVPLSCHGQVRGVVWALAHEARLQFDSQDAFMLAELARVAGGFVIADSLCGT